MCEYVFNIPYHEGIVPHLQLRTCVEEFGTEFAMKNNGKTWFIAKEESDLLDELLEKICQK